jgi:WD40 repeat protein
MRRLFIFLYFLGIVFFAEKLRSQDSDSDVNIQKWLHESTYYSPGVHDACSINNDATFVAIGNNLDRIWIFDSTSKRLVSIIYNGFGCFKKTGFRLSDDGEKLAVCNKMANIIPDEIQAKLPAHIMDEDWKKRTKSFWIYDTKNGNLIKRLDSIVIPYTSSGFVLVADKDGNEKLIDGSGSTMKKTDETKLSFVDDVFPFHGRRYAQFCFSADSNSIITQITGSGSDFHYGVLAEKIDIQSKELKSIYVYSDYNKVKERISRGFGYFGPIKAISRSGDGKYFAALGGSSNLVLFETATGKVVAVQRENENEYDIKDAFCYGCFVLNYAGALVALQCSSPMGSHLQSEKLVADTKGDFGFHDPRGCRVIILDTQTAKLKTEIITPDPLIITSIAFSKDDKYIATGTIWGHVFIWNVSNGKLVKRFSLAKNHGNLKNMTKTIIGFYKDTDEIITVYLERQNKSGYVYKYKISNNDEEKLFDFPP